MANGAPAGKLFEWCQCVLSVLRRDSTIYSAQCDQLGGQTVAVKLYNKGRLSASKLRAIKREAAIMIYITRKQYALPLRSSKQ